MNIEEVIYLWDKSKYRKMILKSLPVIDHCKNLVRPSGVYEKDTYITLGGHIPIYDYLKDLYKKSIFIVDSWNDYLEVREIIRGKIND